MKRILAVIFAVFLCAGLSGCGELTENWAEQMFEELPVPPAGYYVAMVTADQESFGGTFDPEAGWLRIYEDGTGEFCYGGITYQVTTDASNLYLDGEQVFCQFIRQKLAHMETVVIMMNDPDTDTQHIVMLYATPLPDDQ